MAFLAYHANETHKHYLHHQKVCSLYLYNYGQKFSFTVPFGIYCALVFGQNNYKDKASLGD